MWYNNIMQKLALTPLLILAVPLSAMAACVNINRTIKIGSSGDDIKNLQIFLNSSDDTRISVSGAGSPGNETNYFGPASARALSRFQEKFTEEILAPSGIAKGSGILGQRTRNKIRVLSCESSSLDGSANGTSGLAIPVVNGKINTSKTDDDIITFKNEDDLIAKANAWAEKNPDLVTNDTIETRINTGIEKIGAHQREIAAKNPKGVANRFSSVPLDLIGAMPESAWPGTMTNVVGYGFGATNTVTINGRALEVYPPSANGLLLPVVIPEDMKPGTYTLHIKGGVSEADASIEVLEK